MPRDTFTVNNDITDETGIVTKKQDKIITEINIVRGEKFNDIIGWTF